MKELKERVSAVENLAEKTAEEIEKLQENIGMIDVYKAILKSSEEARIASRETDKIFKIMIVTLSILIIALVGTLTITHIEFAKYQENSISKTELIEYLKD